MNLKISYQIDKVTFARIYRAHCHYKFHLRRSFILSCCLLVFVVFMKFVYETEFDGMEYIIGVLVIASGLCNLICDFIIPKVAYKNLVEQQAAHGNMTIQDEGLQFHNELGDIFRSWDQYNKCIETEDAFLLYQRDLFTIIMKKDCKEEWKNIRVLLKERVNQGKEIKQKK